MAERAFRRVFRAGNVNKSKDALDRPYYSLDSIEWAHGCNSGNPLHEDARVYADDVLPEDIGKFRGLTNTERTILELRAKEYTQAQIGEFVGVHQTQVCFSLKRIKQKLKWIQQYKTVPSLEELTKSLSGLEIFDVHYPRKKLSIDDVAAIIRMYLYGTPLLSLAKTYNQAQPSLLKLMILSRDLLMTTSPDIGAQLAEHMEQPYRLVSNYYKRSKKFKLAVVAKILKKIPPKLTN